MQDLLRDIVTLLERRSELASDVIMSADSDRLKGHIQDFLLPRFDDLDAPLMVVLLGSTGSGKSSLFNALAGAELSEVGVLRPTTRTAVAVAPTGQPLPDALVSMRDEGLATVVEKPDSRRHLVVVDAPDFDSIEADNRALARRLLEAADLVVFVTTDTRYADEVPWHLMNRVQARGVPLLNVINRLPADLNDRNAVIDDYRRMLIEGGISNQEVVGVGLGELDSAVNGLSQRAVVTVARALDRLVEDDSARRSVVEASLEAAVADLPGQLDRIGRELEVEASARAQLLELVDRNYRVGRDDIAAQIDKGTFLRSEVLREWQDFVGASKVARVVSEGVGKIAATIRSLFQNEPAVTAGEVREAALSDLTELVVSEANQAAASSAAAWTRRPHGQEAVESHADLWSASPDLGGRFEDRLESWASKIGSEIMQLGEKRADVARAASLGVNVVGTGAIVAVFAHTGGLTGAEAGIAAATAVVNQTLLNAIFGEANVAKFVDEARQRLDLILDEELSQDASRFEAALPIADETEELALEIKNIARRLAE